MQNITAHQAQQISGGILGVTPPQLAQLAVLSGFVVPKALFSIGLSATGLNPNGLVVKVIAEAAQVIMAGGAMVVGNHFFPDVVVAVAAKNQTIA